MPPIAGAALDVAGNVASGLGNAVTTEDTNEATTKIAPTATGQVAENAVLSSPEYQKAANESLQNIGSVTKNIAQPAGQSIMASGQAEQKGGINQLQAAQQQWQGLVQNTNEKMTNTEQAVADANNVSTIDPQRYLDSMGVSGRTLAALGMLVSGAGAGVTGQPNLAMQAFQNNINRDIAAQAQTFQNKLTVAAKQQGLLNSAQDMQKINQISQQMAGVLVNNGASTHLAGLQATLGGAIAPDQANLAKLSTNQGVINNLGAFNAPYINAVKSGNAKHLNFYGLGLDLANEQMTGSGFGGNKNPLQQNEQQIQQTNTTNPALGSTKAAATPSYQVSPQEMGQNVQKPKETFLDALSNAATEHFKKNLDNK